ncbi:hypothetical protein D9V32_02725 [Mycetocola tolaasinivorans]|uniref:Uncharacterized protein n=1 Tax=Mycetocola tolaasinivorans TaxID=76635 RepID=A0A3L7ADC5_9MICO|nr:hypothetical protein [Mycetocola tolaasinivorans]RLP77382.1 hypothetical protein D9V32_02725 [Mycetocola tolaasinivorans]
MSQFESVALPRRRDIVLVWVVALVAAILIWIFAPGVAAFSWLAVALAVVTMLTFVMQLRGGRKTGFIDRVAISIAGSVVILGVMSALMGIGKLLPA